MRPSLLPPRLRRWLGDLADWALPQACLRCRRAAAGPGLCLPCHAALRPPAARRPTALDGSGVAVHAAFAYDDEVAPLLARYKFHGDLAAGRALAGLALPTFRDAPRPHALVPVPLHHDRLRDRGHDQALGLARDWGRALGLPVRHDLLRRQRATRAQTELDAAARRLNLVDAFRARGPCPAHVALVDDVLTTGSTAAAAAQALEAAGAVRIEVWAVACAG